MIKKYLLVFFTITLYSNTYNHFSQKTLDEASKKYSSTVLSKISKWDKLITQAQQSNELNKLKLINDFFNLFPYKTDLKHWGTNDYWATPIEFVGTGFGDCEDYVIAKYFTLLKVGIKEENLRFGYVKYLKRGSSYEEAHMVLLYFTRPDAIPIVLDNIMKRLELATKRNDLKLVYSFNASGLWESKNKGTEHKKLGPNNITKWKNLIERL